jgi:hypothetical protein
MSPYPAWRYEEPPSFSFGYQDQDEAEQESSESENTEPELMEHSLPVPVLHRQDEATREVQDLLETHLEELGEATGPPLGPRMLTLANWYYAAGSQPGAVTLQKDLYQCYLRPQGLYIQPMACNPEVFGQLPKLVKARG